MVDQRVSPIPMLLDVRHEYTGQWRHGLGIAGHLQIRADENLERVTREGAAIADFQPALANEAKFFVVKVHDAMFTTTLI
jgi:hypothetical protein